MTRITRIVQRWRRVLPPRVGAQGERRDAAYDRRPGPSARSVPVCWTTGRTGWIVSAAQSGRFVRRRRQLHEGGQATVKSPPLLAFAGAAVAGCQDTGIRVVIGRGGCAATAP